MNFNKQKAAETSGPLLAYEQNILEDKHVSGKNVCPL